MSKQVKITPLERILFKAEQHKENYPSFNLERFIEQVQEQEPSWIRWASSKTTAQVNKSLKFSRYVDKMKD